MIGTTRTSAISGRLGTATAGGHGREAFWKTDSNSPPAYVGNADQGDPAPPYPTVVVFQGISMPEIHSDISRRSGYRRFPERPPSPPPGIRNTRPRPRRPRQPAQLADPDARWAPRAPWRGGHVLWLAWPCATRIPCEFSRSRRAPLTVCGCEHAIKRWAENRRCEQMRRSAPQGSGS
jgi:hypothetical protein